jgi:hypothetical protein
MVGDKVHMTSGQWVGMTGTIMSHHNTLTSSLVLIDRLQKSFWIPNDRIVVDIPYIVEHRNNIINQILGE